MKYNKYDAWVEVEGKVKRQLGTYYCGSIKLARILAQADAIKAGIGIEYVKVLEIK